MASKAIDWQTAIVQFGLMIQMLLMSTFIVHQIITVTQKTVFQFHWTIFQYMWKITIIKKIAFPMNNTHTHNAIKAFRSNSDWNNIGNQSYKICRWKKNRDSFFLLQIISTTLNYCVKMRKCVCEEQIGIIYTWEIRQSHLINVQCALLVYAFYIVTDNSDGKCYILMKSP